MKGLFIGFTPFYVLYIIKIMGAGDVKLMAVVGAALGYKNTIYSYPIIAIYSGIIALAILIASALKQLTKKNVSTFLSNFPYSLHSISISSMTSNNISQSKSTIPLAAAITGGVLTTIQIVH